MRNQPSTIVVQCRDATLANAKIGGEPVTAFAVDPENEKCKVQVVDMKNGCYQLTFKGVVDGEHRVHVLLRERHISGSPFTVQVRVGRDYSVSK